MKFNRTILCTLALATLLLMAFHFNHHHLIFHSFLLALGTAAGMLVGKSLAIRQRGRVKTVIRMDNCPLEGKADGSSCTVTVLRQYCYVIDTPTPQQICYTVQERHQGRWNAEYHCCEAVVDGRSVCVRP